MTHKERIEYYRAKGQEDYPHYSPPAKLITDYVLDMESHLYDELFVEYKNAYEEGFESARLMLIDCVEY